MADSINQKHEIRGDLPLSFWSDNFSRLKKSSCISEVFLALCEITRHLDFDYCAYMMRGKSHVGEWLQIALDTFPGAWFRTYVDSIDTNADPIFSEASNTCMPVKWSRRHLRKRRFLYRAAMQAGMCHGVSFPLRGPNGTLSLLSISRRHGAIDEDDVILLTIMLYPVLAMAHEIFLTHSVLNRPNHGSAALTNREKQILTQASEGQTSVQIAQNLMVTERTVNFHIENVLRKLGVRSRAHAVAKANAIGIISC